MESHVCREGAACPVKGLLQLLGRPHVLDIVYVIAHLRSGRARFVEIEKALAISPTTLAERLKDLVEIGLLTREAFDEQPPRVEYALAGDTAPIEDAVRAIHAWAHARGTSAGHRSHGSA